MNPYQLIVFDMDGTLLNTRKQVSPASILAIREAVSAGKTVVFGTGRALCEMEEFFSLLPDIRYAILYSGAGIYDIREKRFLKLTPMSPESIRGIMEVSAKRDIMLQVVTDRNCVINRPDLMQMDRYHMSAYRPMFERLMTLVPDVRDYALHTDRPVLKINMYHADPAERAGTLDDLRSVPLEAAYSEISSVECSPAGISKGSALTELCSLLGISAGETIAVGDSGNDLAMLRAAGLAVAMGNSKPEALEAADLIAPDCDSDGCAWVIRNCLL